MNGTAQKSDTKPFLEDIRSLRDLREELRLEVHLFRAEARQRFAGLEDRWREIEKIVETLKHESTEAASEVVQSTKRSAAELHHQYELLKKELVEVRAGAGPKE